MNHLFVDDLTVIDFSYFHPERGIIGESWVVDVELSGQLDEQGMVFDFGLVKKQIKHFIDEQFDHRFVLSKHLSGLVIEHDGDNVKLEWSSRQGHFQHSSPSSAIALVNEELITTTTIARHLEKTLLPLLPENVEGIGLVLREEEIASPFYHYSHGLKKHLGNCQRIVHGHRSRIEIAIDGERHTERESVWAEKLRDAYIATKEDIIGELSNNGIQHTHLRYAAQQGVFELILPSDRVYVIGSDTTVELIAAHIADLEKQEFPEQKIKVKAFEGVGKGSIALR